VGCLGLFFRLLTLVLAVLYIFLVFLAWVDCSIIPGLGRQCVNPQRGYPEHGLYWTAVFLYSPVGIPACLISLFFLLQSPPKLPPSS
jgi:hypothetical protein